jgi:hypothetical protein
MCEFTGKYIAGGRLAAILTAIFDCKTMFLFR